MLSNIVRISILAVGARLPTSYIAREYVQGGGLLAYGPSFAGIYRRAGDFFLDAHPFAAVFEIQAENVNRP